MWVEFWLTALAAAALLYVPGYLFFRALRFSRVLALCCAPLYGAFAYAMLPILYYELHVPCGPAILIVPTLILAVLLFIVLRPWTKASENNILLAALDPLCIGHTKVSFDVVVPLVYLAVGLVATSLLFVSNITAPDVFASRYDNQTHLNLIRAFLDSGKWSSLHHNAYLAASLNAIPRGSNAGSFYPASFHCVVALACSMTGASVTMGINACVTTLCGIVFPLSMFAFMRALLPNQRGAVLFGAAASFCFPNLPWNCLVTGPLYPNLFGMTLLPAVIAWVVSMFDARKALRLLATLISATIVSFVALVLAHPNTIFSLYIFMAPYGASVIAMHVRDSKRVQREFTKTWPIALIILVYAVAVIGVWIALYHVPALRGVLGYMPAGLRDNIVQANPVDALLSTLNARRSYVLLAIPCALGCIPLRHLPKWKVIVFPVVFFAIAYVAVHCGWERIAHWMSAPWYSDGRRMALNGVFFATPIVAYLAHWLYELPQRIAYAKTSKEQGKHARAEDQAQAKPHGALVPRACSIVLIAALGAGLAVFGFRHIYKLIHQRYDITRDDIYSKWESDFVDEAHTITGDSLVINMPHDGSLWSYGANELNTYYREIVTSGHTEDATLIRKHLNEIATNEEVRRVVEKTGAEYVLLLDKDVAYKDGLWLRQYSKEARKRWAGIDAVDDDTPGFELVLAEDDDMRLYKIVK